MKPVSPLDPHELLVEAQRVVDSPDAVIGYMLREVIDKQTELIAAHNELLAKYELHYHTLDIGNNITEDLEHFTEWDDASEPEHD